MELITFLAIVALALAITADKHRKAEAAKLRAMVARLQADNADLIKNASKVYQHGYSDCETVWRGHKLYQMGLGAGERMGYQRAMVEALGVVSEMDCVRQRGELVS